MQISFPGPDGEIVIVSDPRRAPVPTKPARDETIALPSERRPTSWMLTSFRP
jgi:hypothetical protein